MSELKIFKLSEDDFNKMLAETSFQVRQVKIEDGPDKKIKFKIGKKRIVTYEDGLLNGNVVPDAHAHIHFEDVEKEQVVKTRLVFFQAIDHRTEVAIEKYIEVL